MRKKNTVKQMEELAKSQGSIKDIAQKTILRREELKLIRSRKERIEQLEAQKLKEMKDLNTIATVEATRILRAMITQFEDGLYKKISNLFSCRIDFENAFMHFHGLNNLRLIELHLLPEDCSCETTAKNILQVWDTYEKSGYKGILALTKINLGEFETLLAA